MADSVLAPRSAVWAVRSSVTLGIVSGGPGRREGVSFPGGCFFAATALERHELPAREDPDQLAFELHSILLGADTNLNDARPSGTAGSSTA